jgi:hypothetical protein
MKKIVGFIVLFMVLINICVAQTSSNEAQRLIGTWVGVFHTIVFNEDGTGTFTFDGKKSNMVWGISNVGRLGTTIAGWSDLALYFSPDGRRVVINTIAFEKK